MGAKTMDNYLINHFAINLKNFEQALKNMRIRNDKFLNKQHKLKEINKDVWSVSDEESARQEMDEFDLGLHNGIEPEDYNDYGDK